VVVERLSRVGDGFEVICGERALSAEIVVVATGPYERPRVPAFARELDERIVQLHSKGYRNPSQLQSGGVLVVGAGNSGAEIAIELAPHHRTWLSGRDTGHEPTRSGSPVDALVTPIVWWMASRVLTVRTPIGRKVRDRFFDPPRGIPLARVRRKDFAAAGVRRVSRTTGAREGSPLLDDGTVLDVSNVIWCTGFEPNYDWIGLPLPSRSGLPIHDRGLVESCPGLYFVGLPFQYSLSSFLLGGVGRDAEHVVEHIASRRAAGMEHPGAHRVAVPGR
jgi:putative flavoprotein involved in K+ transport